MGENNGKGVSFDKEFAAHGGKVPATYACLAFTERISKQRGESPDAHVKPFPFPGIHSALLVTMHLIRTHWSAFVGAHAFQSLSPLSTPLCVCERLPARTFEIALRPPLPTKVLRYGTSTTKTLTGMVEVYVSVGIVLSRHHKGGKNVGCRRRREGGFLQNKKWVPSSS